LDELFMMSRFRDNDAERNSPSTRMERAWTGAPRGSAARRSPSTAPIALLLAAVLVSAPAAADGVEVAALTYNVHGLPSWIARDGPPARLPKILERAAAYDVVLLQEDFAHQAIVDATHRHAHLFRGNAAWLPLFGAGAGLTILSRWPSAGPPSATPYGTCHGWVSAANDCLGNKGWLRVPIALPGGAVLDVWNTHLDAGRSDADRAVRGQQLDALAAAIEANSKGSAVLAGGDFNLEWDDARDRALLERFAARLGLTIAAQTPPDGWNGHLDYLLVRGAAGHCVTAIDAGKDESFVDAAGKPLSDHPAIRLLARSSPCAENSAEGEP
jgi:endonuclease/exonuclease/phosphatase family metal-dependent hydrolase